MIKVFLSILFIILIFEQTVQSQNENYRFGFGAYTPIGKKKTMIGDGLLVFTEYNFLNKKSNSRLTCGLDFEFSFFNKNGTWIYNNKPYSDFKFNFKLPLGYDYKIYSKTTYYEYGQPDNLLVRLGLRGGVAYIWQKSENPNSQGQKYLAYFVSPYITELNNGVVGLTIACDIHSTGMILFKVLIHAF